MLKKHFTLSIIIILGIIISFTVIYLCINTEDITNMGNKNPIINNNNNSMYQDSPLDIPTEGNLTVIDTNVDTSIRVINQCDETFFSAKKNLLIMFASWCPNCQEEISEVEKILKYYKDNKNVNVVLIAHEYEETITDLIHLIENDVDFGNIEVNLDLKRIIRKTIDPQASTIPISYVVDNDGNVLAVYNESLTLEKAIQMVEK